MRLLITGGSGFIGKQLIPLLKNHDLLILTRSGVAAPHPNYTSLKCDLAQLDTVKKQLASFKPEVCIHLAWEGLPDYSFETCHHNFNISAGLIKMMGDLGCRKIFVSGSCWEYGDITGKVSEEDSPGKTGLFASFKTALRCVAESLAAEYNFQLIWGRIFYAYGPGQRGSSLIPNCIKSFQMNQVPNIRTPYAINDFIHVQDVARYILALVESKSPTRIYNIASGIPITIADLVYLVAERMGKEPLLKSGEYRKEGQGFWADISSLQKRVPYQNQITLSDGIKGLLDEK